MKIALLTDTHFGVRNDSEIFETNIERFNKEIFFPTIKKRQIQTVIHLGDLVDRRKFIAYQTAKRMRENFIEPLMQMKVRFYCIIGNHDIAMRESLNVSAQRELLSASWSNGGVIDRPWPFNFDGLEVLLVPWICAENQEEVLKRIKSWHGKAVFGHFELAGFEMEKGRIKENGLDASFLERFTLVLSGHYHHQSQRGNVRYLGATREMTWADWDDPRGFHIFDTESLELEFIRNPFPVFVKAELGRHQGIDMKNKIVRLTAIDKINPLELEKVVQEITQDNPASVQVVEMPTRVSTEDLELTDTLSMLMNSVDDMNCDRESLKAFLTDLYKEASSNVNP